MLQEAGKRVELTHSADEFLEVVEPPLRLSQLHYEDGVLTYPRHDDRAPESDLALYLAQAHDLMAALPDPGDDVQADRVSDDFEHLRWFELPAVCLPG